MAQKQKVYLTLEGAAVPKTGECLVNHWWIYHPDHGIMLHVGWDGTIYPQCNRDRAIAEYIQPKFYPDHEVVLVPLVFLANAHG